MSSYGMRRWLKTTNHKDVGILYLVTSLAFFLIGGILALLIRTQLAVPENDLVEPDLVTVCDEHQERAQQGREREEHDDEREKDGPRELARKELVAT